MGATMGRLGKQRKYQDSSSDDECSQIHKPRTMKPRAVESQSPNRGRSENRSRSHRDRSPSPPPRSESRFGVTPSSSRSRSSSRSPMRSSSRSHCDMRYPPDEDFWVGQGIPCETFLPDAEKYWIEEQGIDPNAILYYSQHVAEEIHPKTLVSVQKFIWEDETEKTNTLAKQLLSEDKPPKKPSQLKQSAEDPVRKWSEEDLVISEEEQEESPEEKAENRRLDEKIVYIGTLEHFRITFIEEAMELQEKGKSAALKKELADACEEEKQEQPHLLKCGNVCRKKDCPCGAMGIAKKGALHRCMMKQAKASKERLRAHDSPGSSDEEPYFGQMGPA